MANPEGSLPAPVYARFELVVCILPAALLWLLTLPLFYGFYRQRLWFAMLWPGGLAGLLTLLALVVPQALRRPPRPMRWWHWLGLTAGLGTNAIALWALLRSGPLPSPSRPLVIILVLSAAAGVRNVFEGIREAASPRPLSNDRVN